MTMQSDFQTLFSKIWWILCLQILIMVLHINSESHEIFRSACRRDVLMNATDRDKKLIDNANGFIAEIHTTKLKVCVKNCVGTVNCHTVNYKSSSSTENNCQLLNVSKSSTNASLVAANGWVHYEPILQRSPRCRLVNCNAGSVCKEKCETTAGYECVEVDECLSNPCQNGGTCANGVNQYTCTCPGGYEGTNCEKDPVCQKSVCLNGGTCVPNSGSMQTFSCRCPSGYIGIHCEIANVNVARSKPTAQSSIYEGYGANRAVDGNRDTILSHGSCTHTLEQTNAWWMVDLQQEYALGTIIFTNRFSSWARLSNFYIRVGPHSSPWSSNSLCYHYTGTVGSSATETVQCSSPVIGRFLFFVLVGTNFLQLCEVEVFPVSKRYQSCKEMKQAGFNANGLYNIWDAAATTQYSAFCHMSAGGWTLIARFSNADAKNWGMPSAAYWYDHSAVGVTYSTSANSDMINMAFYNVRGNDVKLTSSSSSTNTWLLYGSGCISSTTFRNKMISYGNFRNDAPWKKDGCFGRCSVIYNGVSGVSGFSQYSCSGSIQSSSYIGFWCHSGTGDGAVIMIGGGGPECARADHGIVTTEADTPKFGSTSKDFGDDTTGSTAYALNLWIR